MQIQMRKHDYWTEFMHEWLEKLKRNYYLKMEWNLKERGEDTWVHGCFFFPSSSLYEFIPPQKFDWSEFFVCQPLYPTIKNLNLYILIRNTIFQHHTLLEHYRLDHQHLFSKERCERLDAPLLVLFATLTQMSVDKPFSRSFKGLYI